MDARPDPAAAAPAPDSPADLLRAGALAVVRALRARGFAALWAGGCVRDMVLGHAPKDYDIATDATPDEVIATFARSVPVGAAFGVVRVLLDTLEYEVATFRSEFGYVDGRRPTEVRWAGAREDALRRDFTINGLFYDPIAPDGSDAARGHGGVIDYVGGKEDIARRVVRAIGDPAARFGEDYLRLIRGVRFAARLGFHIEADTFAAIVQLAPRITAVSVERIFEEMDKILSQGDAARGVTLLEAAGLLGHILPEVDAVGAERRLVLLGPAPRPPLVTWGALLCDLDPDAVQAIALRLKTSRDFMRALVEVTSAARRLADWPALGVAAQKRLARLPTFGAALEVAVASGTDVADARRALAGWPPEALAPAPLVGGDDLRAAGFPPGPAYKAALEAVETAQLEGAATTVAEALAVARAVLSPRGGPAADR